MTLTGNGTLGSYERQWWSIWQYFRSSRRYGITYARYNAVFAFAGGTAPTLTTAASGQDALLYYVRDPSTIITTSVLNIS